MDHPFLPIVISLSVGGIGNGDPRSWSASPGSTGLHSCVCHQAGTSHAPRDPPRRWSGPCVYIVYPLIDDGFCSLVPVLRCWRYEVTSSAVHSNNVANPSKPPRRAFNLSRASPGGRGWYLGKLAPATDVLNILVHAGSWHTPTLQQSGRTRPKNAYLPCCSSSGAVLGDGTSSFSPTD